MWRVKRGHSSHIQDPDAAFEICKKYVEGLEENEDVQRAVLDATLLYWQGDPLGASDPAAWQRTVDVMSEIGLLAGPVAAESAFTNDYLP